MITRLCQGCGRYEEHKVVAQSAHMAGVVAVLMCRCGYKITDSLTEAEKKEIGVK